ncbi:hypothetical protein ABEZ32_27675 [Bacillus mycoides]
MLPKEKSISGIADVQGCGVSSPLSRQTGIGSGATVLSPYRTGSCSDV